MVLRRQLLSSLALAFVLCAFLGYRYPASDMLLLLPFIEHGVIPGDLYFGSVPPQYAFVIWFLRMASHVMPLAWFCAGLIYAAATMIMFGLLRIIEAVTCKPVNLLVAAAIVVATGVEMTGNILVGCGYHPQMTAFGFFVLALAMAMEGRSLLAVGCVVGAGLFHPLLGLYCVLFIVAGLLWSGARAGWMVLVLPVSLVIALPAVCVQVPASEAVVQGYVAQLTDVAARYHYHPSEWGFFRVIWMSCVLGVTAAAIRIVPKMMAAWIAVMWVFVVLGLVGCMTHFPTLVLTSPLKVGCIGLVLAWVILIPYLQSFHPKVPKIAVMVLCLLFFFRYGEGALSGRVKFLPQYDAEWVKICAEAKAIGKPGDIFYIPVDNWDFQWLSGQAAYVDSKHFPFEGAKAMEWGHRLWYGRHEYMFLWGQKGVVSDSEYRKITYFIRPSPDGGYTITR